MSRIVAIDIGIRNVAIAVIDGPQIPVLASSPQPCPKRKCTKEEAVRKAMEILSEPPVFLRYQPPYRHNNDLQDAEELLKESLDMVRKNKK